ncbi:MAG: helix-turn-helix transcriptional regulator [Chloroflexi bacterium]|nr:MAG: helix-turn-helix transcriptional regulator [Chloroflexota bacterium]
MHGQRTASLLLGLVAGYVFSRRVLDRRAVEGALTDRQREILRAVAAGRTTKEIASEFGITPASVNTHIRRARMSLGVPTRAAAAARVTGQVLVVPWRPRRSAAASMARTTSATRSSNGRPRASAPFNIMSRLTARANALSFIFFRTEEGSTSRTALDGLTSATAVTNPQSSSTA